jgi:hypothetical protein
MIRRTLALVVMLWCFGCNETPEMVEDFRVDQQLIAESPGELVELLAISYRERSLALFSSLLANDPANNAEFLFVLDPAGNLGDSSWDYDEMVRIHQRMFEPENTPPGEPPVPAENWIVFIAITLSPNINFSERTDLYESAQNPTGLDPAKWAAVDAAYSTDVLFDLQNGNDLQITGQSNFLVIEDLTKEPGAAGKYLLLQWNDLAQKPIQKTLGESKSWSEILSLFK